MKKNLFGILAIAIALVSFAFTENSKRVLTYKFNFNSSDFTQNSVQTKSNWIVTTSPLCTSNVQELACTIEVTDTYTHLVTEGVESSRVLNTSGSIPTISTAQFATSGKYYVTGGTGIANKFNQQEPE